MHVLGPFARFPLAAERAYNVAEAPLAAHESMQQAVGLERTVLVQASGHGTDNRAMLAALVQLGARGRAVAVVEADTPVRAERSGSPVTAAASLPPGDHHLERGDRLRHQPGSEGPPRPRGRDRKSVV